MRTALIAPLVCLFALALCTGCMTGGKGPTDEEQVMQQLKAFCADFVAGNADKILGYVSEDFSHERVADKKTLAEHLQKAIDSGKAKEFPQMIKDHDGKIILDAAKVTVNKKAGTAVVYPITASANEGSVTVEMTFKKDKDKVWRILTLNIEGI